MIPQINHLHFAVISALLFGLANVSFGQSVISENVLASPDRLVRELYASVSFDSGSVPDWGRVRSMFVRESIIAMRATRDSMRVYSLDGFVKDFVDFIEAFHADRTGFKEKVITTKLMIFGDIAHVLVLYEASIPGSPRPPQRGIDSFHLIKKDGRWWIVSIANDLLLQQRMLPAELQD